MVLRMTRGVLRSKLVLVRCVGVRCCAALEGKAEPWFTWCFEVILLHAFEQAMMILPSTI